MTFHAERVPTHGPPSNPRTPRVFTGETISAVCGRPLHGTAFRSRVVRSQMIFAVAVDGYAAEDDLIHVRPDSVRRGPGTDLAQSPLFPSPWVGREANSCSELPRAEALSHAHRMRQPSRLR